MNIEAMSFGVIVAVLGMAVVFGFLWFLNVLMTTIKMIFGEREERDTIASDPAPSALPSTKVETIEGVPQWVLAAVAAFVIEEELDAQRSAEAWVPDASGIPDAWTATPRF